MYLTECLFSYTLYKSLQIAHYGAVNKIYGLKFKLFLHLILDIYIYTAKPLNIESRSDQAKVTNFICMWCEIYFVNIICGLTLNV